MGIHEQGQGRPAAQEPLRAGLHPAAAGELAGPVSVDAPGEQRPPPRSAASRSRSSGRPASPGGRPAPRRRGSGQHRAVGGENPAAGRERSFLDAERATGRPELREEELRRPANLPAGRPLGQLDRPGRARCRRRAAEWNVSRTWEGDGGDRPGDDPVWIHDRGWVTRLGTRRARSGRETPTPGGGARATGRGPRRNRWQRPSWSDRWHPRMPRGGPRTRPGVPIAVGGGQHLVPSRVVADAPQGEKSLDRRASLPLRDGPDAATRPWQDRRQTDGDARAPPANSRPVRPPACGPVERGPVAAIVSSRFRPR